jgi:hypothetical protein
VVSSSFLLASLFNSSIAFSDKGGICGSISGEETPLDPSSRLAWVAPYFCAARIYQVTRPPTAPLLLCLAKVVQGRPRGK